ncbi:MAG: VOC family protein [Flavobacteriales bacterium]
MKQKIGHITILVKDYDEALNFYTEKLGFEKKQDVPFGDDFRWLTVKTTGQTEVAIVFVKADTQEKEKCVGKQVADHVFLTLETDDVHRD